MPGGLPEPVEPGPAADRTVLLVDDEDISRELLATVLEGLGYRVLQAEDGEAAWTILQEGEVRLLVTDWLMPVLDGPALCRRIRERSRHYVYILMLTGQHRRESLVLGLEAGADDFLTKPVDFDELQARLKVGERIIRLERQLSRRNDRLRTANARLRDAYRRMQHDLEAAAETQLRLLPRPGAVGGVDIDWFFEPSSHIGGDVFNVLPLSDGEVAFFHVDVVGHGVRAALRSFVVHDLLSAKRTSHAPLAVVDELNQRFATADGELSYFTLLYGVLNHRTGEGSLVQAGHPSPLLLPAGDGEVRLLGSGGLPIGMFEAAAFEAVPFKLAPGDRLALYSDGIVECEDAAGTPFGEERLAAHLAATRKAPLGQVTGEIGERLRRWRKARHPEDDLSFLVLARR